jgi:hypothetical protein
MRRRESVVFRGGGETRGAASCSSSPSSSLSKTQTQSLFLLRSNRPKPSSSRKRVSQAGGATHKQSRWCASVPLLSLLLSPRAPACLPLSRARAGARRPPHCPSDARAGRGRAASSTLCCSHDAGARCPRTIECRQRANTHPSLPRSTQRTGRALPPPRGRPRASVDPAATASAAH